MFRWTRNIFAAATIAVLACWLVFALTVDDSSLAFPIFFVVIGLMLSIVVWAMGLTRLSTARVRERSIVILSYMEQAVRLNLPLSKMLIAAEASERPWIGRRIGRLRKQLDEGSSIADALRKSVPGLSARNVALIRAAENVGRVGPQLTELVRHERYRQNSDIAERTFLRSYPVAMVFVIIIILMLVMVFVMPKFQQLFHDFRTPLPTLTLAVISFTKLFDDLGWLLFAIGAALLAAFAQQLRQRTGWLAPLKLFTSDRDLGDICHIISEELKANMPLGDAIHGASQLAIGKRTRGKLRRWRDEIERGSPIADAARDAGLPALIVGLPPTADGFEFLSRYYAGKFSRLKILLRAGAVPAMVFFFGVVVAILALTLFLPLIALINSISPGGPSSSWL